MSGKEPSSIECKSDSPVQNEAKRRRIEDSALSFSVKSLDGCRLIVGHGGLRAWRLYDEADGVMGVWEQDPDFNFKAHIHQAEEFIFCLGGSAQTFVNDEWKQITPGQCLIPGPMVKHWTRTQDELYKALYIFPDGPQDNRKYYYLHDESHSERPVSQPPVLTPKPDLDKIGWQPLHDGPDFKVSMLILGLHQEVTSTAPYRYCYVIDGKVELSEDESSAGVVEVKQTQLVVGALLVGHVWRIVGQSSPVARLLLVQPRRHSK